MSKNVKSRWRFQKSLEAISIADTWTYLTTALANPRTGVTQLISGAPKADRYESLDMGPLTTLCISILETHSNNVC